MGPHFVLFPSFKVCNPSIFCLLLITLEYLKITSCIFPSFIVVICGRVHLIKTTQPLLEIKHRNILLGRADGSAIPRDNACALARICTAVGGSAVTQWPGLVGIEWSLKEPDISLMWKNHESETKGGRELKR